jgi:hypothetical protein
MIALSAQVPAARSASRADVTAGQHDIALMR